MKLTFRRFVLWLLAYLDIKVQDHVQAPEGKPLHEHPPEVVRDKEPARAEAAGDKVAKHMELAINEIGTYAHDNGSNPEVEKYFEATNIGGSDDDVPWCAAFVGWVLEQSGHASTKGANARSYLNWGKGVQAPKYGDVVVLWREDPDSWKGHIGFYAGPGKDGYVKLLGGNQSGGVNIKEFPETQVLGYRRLSTVGNSKTMALTGALMAGFVLSDYLTEDMLTAAIGYADYLPGPAGWVFKGLGYAALMYIGLERIRKMNRTGV